jgi:hypothetical protein
MAITKKRFALRFFTERPRHRGGPRERRGYGYSTTSTLTFATPLPVMPSVSAADAETSTTRPRTNGPRSLTRTVTERPRIDVGDAQPRGRRPVRSNSRWMMVAVQQRRYGAGQLFNADPAVCTLWYRPCSSNRFYGLHSSRADVPVSTLS